MNTTSAIRFNAFARSCNDDYSPMMEDLCVKMTRLSLEADSKLEAYDAKLDRFFNEEKVDNAIDEKNQETFDYNDDDEYSLEVCAFNTRYGTYFTPKKLSIFLDYVDHTGLTIEDAIDYSQSCHACGSQLNEFCGEYCNKRCAEHIECDFGKCVRGDDCLICAGYPETTCYWGPNCSDCASYDGPESKRYPYECFHCLTQMTDHEGYDVDEKLYCNNCAVDLFDNTGHLEDQEQDSKKRPRDEEDDDESSSECSSLDDDLHQRKRAKHIRFEGAEVMVIDLLSQVEDYDVEDYDVEDYDVEDYDYVIDPMVIDLSQDDEDDYDYDYAESVVDDDSDEEESAKTVTMSQKAASSMVAMIQDLRDENAELRHELELLRGQRRMLFPEGSSISFTDEDGQRYLNIHAVSPYASAQAPLTMADLEGDLEANSDDSDFAMDEDN